VVYPHARGQSGLGVPFLVGISQERHKRSLAIQQEVFEYLEAVAAALPMLEMIDILPEGTPRPRVPVPPDCLEWEERVEKWGLPAQGTWLDQPKWFMEDLRAAGNGRARWQAEQRKQMAAQLTLDVPETKPMMTR